MRIIRQNLGWATVYNVTAIPAAALGLLNPWLSGVGMAVSSAVAFGIFVSLDGLYVEGLVHVSDLGSDYFHFDPSKHLLLGERTGRRFRIGDRVRVKVVRVDIETSKIDFVLDD